MKYFISIAEENIQR